MENQPKDVYIQDEVPDEKEKGFVSELLSSKSELEDEPEEYYWEVMEKLNKIDGGLNKSSPIIKKIVEEFILEIFEKLDSDFLYDNESEISFIIDDFEISKDLIKSEKYQNLLSSIVYDWVGENSFSEDVVVKSNGLGLDYDKFYKEHSDVIADDFKNTCINGDIDEIKDAIDNISLSTFTDEIKEGVTKGLFTFFDINEYEGLELINYVIENYPEIFTNNEKVKKEVARFIIKTFSGVEDDEETLELIDSLIDLMHINVSDLYHSLNDYERDIFDKLEKAVPNIQEKIFSSLEIFSSFIKFSEYDIKTIEQNPFLINAFNENPVMAVKLLSKYPLLDTFSQENIDLVFESKQKIINDNPDIDSNSYQFRILMQKHLEPYRRNIDILSQMRERGVNADGWLNYQEEVLFELGGEKASYAELIKLPSERIKLTLKKYENVVRDVLSKYRKELLSKEVLLTDISEMEENLKQMEQLAQEAVSGGQYSKAQGIQKGIEGLRKQIAKPKKIPAWLKIMSDVDTVAKLFKKVTDVNTDIAELDGEVRTLSQDISRESQIKMFENKQKIEEKSKEFISLLHTTSLRLDSVIGLIQNNLTQTLGEDVSKEVISAIETHLGEDREHFNHDKTTLEDVLKMNESEDDVKGTLLKIKVWDRNPDIDLYMGNYSDCCIRIDSDYHGSESPISDYITDLGIQIVAVYDEKTGKPFAAAWCFVGEDEVGNKAFVIDNIEATGPYMQYKDDIQGRLKAYIEQYAKASGLDVVSQGPHNNDMVVTQNLEERYTKLGGYNVESGYFLEAEPKESEDN